MRRETSPSVGLGKSEVVIALFCLCSWIIVSIHTCRLQAAECLGFPFFPWSNTEQLHAQEFVTLQFFAMFVAVPGGEVVTGARGWERIGKSIGMQILLFSRPTSLPAPSNRFL